MSTLFVDIETVGEPWDGQLVAVGWAIDDDDPEVRVSRGDSPSAQSIRRMLEDPENIVVCHTKYDVRWLRLHGWTVNATLHDTQVMAWVLNENMPLTLEFLTRRYLGRQMDKRIKRIAGVPMFRLDDGSYVTIDQVPWDQMVRYNADDVEELRDLYKDLRRRMDTTAWDVYWLEEEVPFTQVLLDMEVAGLPIDLEAVAPLAEELEADLVAEEKRLMDEAALPPGFNLGSGDQLAAYLYSYRFDLSTRIDVGVDEAACIKACVSGDHEDCDDYHMVDLLPEGFTLDHVGRQYVDGRYSVKGLNLTIQEYTDSGKPSTASPVLIENYSTDPWVRDLIHWRKLRKVLTTYLRVFPRVAHEGRIYARFNQTGTKTGRLSSSGPNMQNQPARGELGKKVRELFRGNLIVADYSQLEPRLMAHFSQDPELLRIYRNGLDIYLEVAKGIFGGTPTKDSDERTIAKVLVLSMGYGAGSRKVAQILAINGYPTDVPTAKSYLQEERRFFRTFFDWREQVIEHVHRVGYVTTLGGRHRRLKASFKDRKNFKLMGYGERQAVNAIIQGSAGDIVRRVMVRWPYYVEAGLHDAMQLLAQVHDELMWEWQWDVDFSRVSQTGQMYMTDDNVKQALAGLKVAGEEGHGFQLDVPLLFEPAFGDSWYSAKAGTPEVILPDDEAEEDAA